MAVPEYYTGLYVNIYDEDGVAVGSGLCFDGRHILTCAHVINAACNLDLETYTRIGGEKEIKVRFILNADLKDEELIATTLHWGWDEEKLKAMIEERRNPAVMRTDLAILKLQTEDNTILKNLTNYAKKLAFLKGNLNTSSYEAWVLDPGNPGVPENVKGKFGENDKGTGTTIVYPDDNAQKFFFDSGSSGAPVFGTITFPDQTSKTGITGYMQYLKQKGKQKEARMINGVNIEDWFKKNCHQPKPVFNDMDMHKAEVINKLTGETLLKNLEKKWGCSNIISCNRIHQVNEIRQKHSKNEVRNFLIFGDDKQKLDFFVDRYRWEFLDSSGKKSELINISIPGASIKEMFCNTLIDNIHVAFRKPNNITKAAETITFDEIIEKFALDDSTWYVMNYVIENAALTPLHSILFTWLNTDFLKPIMENPRYDNIHVFISYYFKQGEDYKANKAMIDTIFQPVLPELGNVTRQEIEDWIKATEPNKKDKVLKYFPVFTEYSMEDVLRYYKQAIDQMEPF